MLGLLIIGILPVCVIVFLLVTLCLCIFFFFFFNDTATTEIYTLSLHDALPICSGPPRTAGTTANPWPRPVPGTAAAGGRWPVRPPLPSLAFPAPAGRQRPRGCHRSEEHTSELQSPCNLVCRLLLEKKKTHQTYKSSAHAQ